MSKKSLSTFTDIRPVLDAALTAGGAVFYTKDRGAAIRWRQRAYQMRSAMLALDAERMSGIPGYSPSTPYDNIHIVVEDNEVQILLREPVAEVFGLDGKPLTIMKVKPDEDTSSELEAIAQSFAKGLKHE